MHSLFVFAILSVLSSVSAHGDYGAILAEQLNQYCDNRERSFSEHAPRIGESSPQGLQGPTGPPGVVNYTKVDEMITTRLKEITKTRRTDCVRVMQELTDIENETGGLFEIYSEKSGRKMEVYCDLTTDGGGWIVFQRRVDGTENFKRNWVDYVTGFGNLQHEFWMGLEKLHRLTFNGNFELRIDLEDGNGRKGYALYTIFSVGDASTNYRLNVGGYSGTAGDSLSLHNGQKFTTLDRDNDEYSSNCAQRHRGAWWYKSCHRSNLNGEYASTVGKYTTGGIGYGVEWYHWNNAYYYSMKSVEMKFRPSY